jgi:hypothetical protein
MADEPGYKGVFPIRSGTKPVSPVDADPEEALKLYRGAWDEDFGTMPGASARAPDPALVEAVKDDPYFETAWPRTPAVEAVLADRPFAWWVVWTFFREARLGLRKGRVVEFVYLTLMAASAAVAVLAAPLRPRDYR